MNEYPAQIFVALHEFRNFGKAAYLFEYDPQIQPTKRDQRSEEKAQQILDVSLPPILSIAILANQINQVNPNIPTRWAVVFPKLSAIPTSHQKKLGLQLTQNFPHESPESWIRIHSNEETMWNWLINGLIPIWLKSIQLNNVPFELKIISNYNTGYPQHQNSLDDSPSSEDELEAIVYILTTANIEANYLVTEEILYAAQNLPTSNPILDDL